MDAGEYHEEECSTGDVDSEGVPMAGGARCSRGRGWMVRRRGKEVSSRCLYWSSEEEPRATLPPSLFHLILDGKLCTPATRGRKISLPDSPSPLPPSLILLQRFKPLVPAKGGLKCTPKYLTYLSRNADSVFGTMEAETKRILYNEGSRNQREESMIFNKERWFSSFKWIVLMCMFWQHNQKKLVGKISKSFYWINGEPVKTNSYIIWMSVGHFWWIRLVLRAIVPLV